MAAIKRARRLGAGVCSDKVLLVMPPGPEFLISLLGCVYAGVVVVPLPVARPGAHAERLNTVVRDCGAATILCNTESAPVLARHLHQSGQSSSARLLVVDSPEWNELPRVPEAALAGLQKSPEETILVQYTSGSTRLPKGVALNSINLLSNASLLAERWSMGEDTVHVSWLPHYHDMGLLGLLFPLLYGGQVVQMSPLAFVQHPVRWLRALSEYRGTITGGSAFAYSLCLEHISDADLALLNLSHVRGMFCGAEPIPAGLLQRFRERFACTGLAPDAVYPCYGLAEATLFVAGERAWSSGEGKAAPKAGSEACLLSPETYRHLRIVSPETGCAVGDGTVGEIWASGPWIAAGYVQSGVLSDEGMVGYLPGSSERYLRTGDLGWIADGRLGIAGRLKDTLIARGANIAAVDVECLAAEQHTALNPLAAAAVSVAHAGSGETAALLMEVRAPHMAIEDFGGLAEQIRCVVRAEHGLELESVRFVKQGALERTSSGKIRRQIIAARLRAGYQYPEAGA